MNEEIPGLVSTVIPVFNRPSMLRDAVQTVLNQTYRPIEILIADDASTDDTPQVGMELQSRYPDIVRFLRSQENSGSGPGPMRELGRINARGEFLQYLDSDDRLLPNKCADQVRALREHPECDIAYGYTRLVDEHNNVLTDPFKWTARDIPFLYPGLLVDRWWCTHTPMYRRTLTDRIGPWSRLRWSQDWEYDSRAGALGARLINCHSYVSEHRHHSGLRQTSDADWSRDPVRLRNRIELLTALWNHAQTAGVQETAPERQHFARWCFAISRQCAVAGLASECEIALNLAEEAAADGAARRGLGTFRTLSRFVGHRSAGRFLKLLESLRFRPGKSTLAQSFSKQPQ